MDALRVGTSRRDDCSYARAGEEVYNGENMRQWRANLWERGVYSAAEAPGIPTQAQAMHRGGIG